VKLDFSGLPDDTVHVPGFGGEEACVQLQDSGQYLVGYTVLYPGRQLSSCELFM
jgi:hypothetical protein